MFVSKQLSKQNNTDVLLDQILVKIAEINGQNGKTCLVFDLDSTLFDVSPRLQQILVDFAAIPENQAAFPNEMKFFPEIKTHRKDWGITNALMRSGLSSASPAFQEAVRKFWRQNFFSGHYLEYDIPYEGAVDYVRQIDQMGSEIIYLTGRDVHRMGEGSKKILHKWNFPLDEQRSHLVLKPQKEMDDGLFKRDWFLDLDRSQYDKIWFFENEPVNVNLIHQALPEIEIIFFDSTHAGIEEPPDHLPKILNFITPLNSSKNKL
jgi:hypothetical protein